MRLVSVLSAAAVLSLSVCAFAFSPNDQQAAPAQNAPAVDPAAPMAVVNGTPITRAEFDRALGAYLNRFRQTAGSMHGGVTVANDEMKTQVLQQLIDRTVLYQEAKKYPVADLDAKVDEELKGIRARFPDDDRFKQALASDNLDEAGLRELIAQQIVVRSYVESQLQPGVQVSDAEIAKFYEDNRAKFATPEQVKASHILVLSQPGDPQEKRDAARARAEDLRKRAAAGEDFAELAKANSEDPGSAPRGGDLGFFTRDRMVKPFADAAFAMEKGAVSDVVETRFGYHVILVTDRQAAGERSLDEVKEDIGGYLKARSLDEVVRAKVDELKKSAKIEMVASQL